MPHMRERVPNPDEPETDPDALPDADPKAGKAARPSDDAITEAPPHQAETEATNARTTEDF